MFLQLNCAQHCKMSLELKFLQLNTFLQHYISEIDNAIIEIDNEEIPIMDGSARDFLQKIEKIG